MMLLGLTVGSLLRPHIMIPWVASVVTVGLFQKGQRFYAILALLLLPVVMHSFQSRWALDATVQSQLTFAEKQGQVLGQFGGGSTFEQGESGPIFVVSGFVALFFRPFPWQLGSLRMILAFFDTWVTTSLLVGSIIWMIKPEGRSSLKLPEVQVAVLASVMFCVFFSYLPNEGLIVRQRVQAVPALLALVVLPRWQRKDFQLKLRMQMRRFVGGRLAYLK